MAREGFSFPLPVLLRLARPAPLVPPFPLPLSFRTSLRYSPGFLARWRRCTARTSSPSRAGRPRSSLALARRSSAPSFTCSVRIPSLSPSLMLLRGAVSVGSEPRAHPALPMYRRLDPLLPARPEGRSRCARVVPVLPLLDRASPRDRERSGFVSPPPLVVGQPGVRVLTAP